jgi:hypothetical protein
MADKEKREGDQAQDIPVYESFLTLPVDGKLKVTVVNELTRTLKDQSISIEVDVLKQIGAKAVEQKTKKEARITERNSGNGDADSIAELNENDREVIISLNELIAEVDKRVKAKEANTRIEKLRVEAKAAVEDASKNLPEGPVTGADLIAHLAAAMNVDVRTLATVGAMFDRFSQQAPAEGKGDGTKPKEKTDQEKFNENVVLVKRNREVINKALKKKFTENNIDLIADWAVNPPKLGEVSFGFWRTQIVFSGMEEKDPQKIFNKMIEIAHRNEQDKNVLGAFRELGMSYDPAALLEKYKTEIDNRGIKGVPESPVEGKSHDTREVVIAHLLIMVDLGLIKAQAWMKSDAAKELHKAALDKLSKDHSDELRAFYTRRLDRIVKVFPVLNNEAKAKVNGDTAGEDGSGDKDKDKGIGDGSKEKKVTAEELAKEFGIAADEVGKGILAVLEYSFDEMGLQTIITDKQYNDADLKATILPALCVVKKGLPEAAKATTLLQQILKEAQKK